ncbi:conserved hypothetical protein [Burkholderia sp. 8Y]|uniref:hypothetical protein n=1 Tax=Burkholderia sp. 8Y TaxID=2653133 RepID=UPI0012F35927|nr:hypothetical protein [Burkholderia sp. 8Y]VXC51309.1 conserved hypothetical protein [Burkholderia sp. 8Y]
MQTRLQAIIDAVRPRRALFTTFTLSVNWFESFCLPLLKVSGCGKVDLLVDSREACKSTDESTSLYAGNAYRVIPVHQDSGGFFHPKIAYLERGSGDDVLVVGSGNLTTSGQNANLEVLDSVTAQAHPLVFEAFAEFASQFVLTPGLSAKAAANLRYYAERASAVAASAPPAARENTSAWLVHTLVGNAGQQFASLVRQHLPDAVGLTVFGPYFDPAANAACELARQCGTSELSLGVRQGKKGYVIPLEKVNALPRGTRYVVPEEKVENRFAHAKVFEVRSPTGCMVMTGSVNATNQSLFGLENVEISLARKLNAPAFKWKTLTEEELAGVEYEACKFKSPELGRKAPALDAQWQSDGVITGKVSPRPNAHTVSLEIWRDSDLEHTLDDVELESDGSFTTTRVSRSTGEGARRLKLTSELFTVIGWLNVESELAARPWEKELARAAARIRSGTGNDRDLRPVLNWMTGVLHRKPEPTPDGKADAKRTPAPTSNGGNQREEQRKLKELRAYQDWRKGDEPALNVSAQLAEESMAAAFRSLNDDIRRTRFGPVGRALGQLDIITPEQEYGSNKAPVEDDVENGVAKEQNAIDAMLEKLPVVLAKDATGPMVSAAVAMAATDALAEAIVVMTAGGVQAPTANATMQAFTPTDPYGLGAWLAQYSAYAYDVDNRERLLPVLCTFACCAYDASPTLALGAIKEQIEDFAQREVPLGEWEEAVALGLDLDAFELVRDAGATSRVFTHVARIVGSLTLREELELMLGSLFGDATPSGVNPRYQKVFECLQKLKDRKLAKNETVFGLIPQEIPLTNVASCPNCRTVVRNIGEVSALRTRRVTIHGYCEKPVFAGLRAAELTRYNVLKSLYADWSR